MLSFHRLAAGFAALTVGISLFLLWSPSATVQAQKGMLVVNEPKEGAFYRFPLIPVSGQIAGQGLRMEANGEFVGIDKKGNFYGEVHGVQPGPNKITVKVFNDAGEIASEVRTVILDTIHPTLAVTEPSDGFITTESSILVKGTASDNYSVAVTINKVPVRFIGATSAFSTPVSLQLGVNNLSIRAEDPARHLKEVFLRVLRINPGQPPLGITIDGPRDELVTNTSEVRYTGAVLGKGVKLTLNGSPFPITEDGFFSSGVDVVEGRQALHFQATDEKGNRVDEARFITRDSVAPVLTNILPENNSVISSPTLTVTGRVADATTITISVEGHSVTVPTCLGPSGCPFTVANIPIKEGFNYFTVTAIDEAGNITRKDLQVIGKDRTPPLAPVLFPVASPTRLNTLSLEGKAEPGTRIAISGSAVNQTTDALPVTGLFFARLQLGSGLNRFSVTATDDDGNVSPPATLSLESNPNLPAPAPGQPAQISSSTGNSQRGLVQAELPRPLVAFVSDRDGQPVPNVAVTFALAQGNGQFVGGGDTMIVSTNPQGYAIARFLSGATPAVQMVRADFSANRFPPATFLAETFAPAAGGVTAVAGGIYDQNLRPLPNVMVRLGGQQTRSGSDGRFRLTQVSAGPHQLLDVVGRDQVPFPGRWPNLSFDIDVLPGIENRLGRPIFLPRVNEGIDLPLDSHNLVTTDTVYELPVAGGSPPLVVKARAGTQVTFPPDISNRRFSVTRIPVNRVPMPLEDGRATSLYISVQPSGAIFEPPLEVTFPNLDQRPANAQVLLMSFDHDAGRYVRAGTGRVSSDGKVVTGDPGSGIRIGAWHGFPPVAPDPQTSGSGGPLDGPNCSPARISPKVGESCLSCDVAFCSYPGTNVGGGVYAAVIPSSLSPCRGEAFNCVEPPVTVLIKAKGKDVTDKTLKVVVGQKINLTVEVQNAIGPFPMMWDVPGRPIKNWKVGKVKENGEEKDLPELKNLTDSDLKMGIIDFAWIDGAENRKVTCTVTIKGKTYLGAVTFNIARPKVKVTSKTGENVIGDYPDDPEDQKRAGVFYYDGTRGIRISPKREGEEIEGEPIFVQLTHTRNEVCFFNQVAPGFVFDQSGLDKSYPYPSPYADSLGFVSDTPFFPLVVKNQGKVVICDAQITNDYTMYLLFQPIVEDEETIPVPLAKVDWDWRARAILDVAARDYTLDKKVQSTKKNPDGVEVFDYPTWTQVVDFEKVTDKDLKTQKCTCPPPPTSLSNVP